jgi:hypothetical protein
MWASRHLTDAQLIKVYRTDRDEPALELRRIALDLNASVWIRARKAFFAMPTATFLVANLEARLAVEDDRTAARSIAWLAASDALDALEELTKFNTGRVRSERRVAARLNLVEYSSRQCLSLLAPECRELIVDLADLFQRILIEFSKPTRQRIPIVLKSNHQRLYKVFEKLPIPSEIPTLDPRPLDVVENDPD